MSVIKLITKARGTRGRASADGQHQFTLNFQAVTDDIDDGPDTVGAALGFNPFDQYAFGNDYDPLCLASDIEITRSSESPYIWDVTVDFDSKVEDWDENPLNRPSVIEFGFVQFQRPVWQDIFGNGILNSAGRYFDPPPEVDDSRLQITISKNQPIFDAGLAVAYQDAVNVDPWFGFLPNQVKVANITGKEAKEAGITFYEMRYEFQVRYEGWTLQILDQGLYQANGQPCVDANGDAVTEPVPLDGSGNQLASPSVTNCKFLTFYVYRQLPFLALDLP